MPNRFHKGFENLPDEMQIDNLPVRGTLPTWLNGTLVRNGPGRFDVNGNSYRHWFDGLAMLRAFTITAGKVSYANRYLRSSSYHADLNEGHINYRGFAVDPCMTLFQKAMSLFIQPKLGTNPVVNITQAADKFIAMTEAPLAVEFDPKTLATIREFSYSEDGGQIGASTSTAHPHYDFAGQTGYNYMLKIGARMAYKLYAQHGTDHHCVATIPVTEPAYMHSFSITPRYLILSEYPFKLTRANLLSLATVQRPFIENMTWKPDDGTRFIVVDKTTGEIVNEAYSEGFFAFHHVNAYETSDGIIVDIAAYDDNSVIDGLYLDALRGDHYANEPARLRRYRVPLQGDTVQSEQISDANIELPRIYYRQHNGHAYRYTYGVSLHAGTRDFSNELVKVDVQRGTASHWFVDGCYPSEPVFVPAPDATAEDEGVLLSVVLDTAADKSFLMVLDAQSMTEIARAETPHALPFGFHGQFFS